MVSHVAPSHCIIFHSLHTMCNMHSQERHVMQCEHWHAADLHQLPSLSLFFWGVHDVWEHVKCQIVSFIPSDAKVSDLSARVYSTKPSVCHAFTDELRHAKILQHLSYFNF